jgi:hypothetical protein
MARYGVRLTEAQIERAQLRSDANRRDERIVGEVTTDGGIHRRVTPRIVVDARDLAALLARCPWLAAGTWEGV